MSYSHEFGRCPTGLTGHTRIHDDASSDATTRSDVFDTETNNVFDIEIRTMFDKLSNGAKAVFRLRYGEPPALHDESDAESEITTPKSVAPAIEQLDEKQNVYDGIFPTEFTPASSRAKPTDLFVGRWHGSGTR